MNSAIWVAGLAATIAGVTGANIVRKPGPISVFVVLAFMGGVVLFMASWHNLGG